MRNFLIKCFIKNYENVKDPKVREAYGRLAGAVGIVTNLFLCIIKITIGLFVNSIAIIADGINNLADTSSSAITLIGFKLASKPRDSEHPYGHARIEYITGLIVSMFIIVIGFKLVSTSIEKILNPTPLEFSYITIAILVIAIAVKVWQASFNINTGKVINSSTLKATGMDSRNDVIATSAVLLSVIIGKVANFQADGIMGFLVAVFIIYSGIQLIRETSSPLLGKAPDESLVKEIECRICSEEGVLGIHDLVVHDYGPGRVFASVHVEVDCHEDLIKSHDLIDNIERTIGDEFQIHFVIHMDPLDTKDPLTIELNQKVSEILTHLDGVIGYHDLRVVAGYTHNNIIFDLVVSPECKLSEDYIQEFVETQLQLIDKDYYVVITFDQGYVKNNI